MDLQALVISHPFFVGAALAGSIALGGMIRDYRHSRRADLDTVSLVSWGHVSIVAMIVAIVCLAIGIRAGG